MKHTRRRLKFIKHNASARHICTFIFFLGLTIIIPTIIIQLKKDTRDPSTLRRNHSYASTIDRPFTEGCTIPQVSAPRANATFVILARNSDLKGVITSMKSLESHFNKWFHYPYVFLNNEKFDESFKKTVRRYTMANVSFGEIPQEHWKFSNQNSAEFNEHIKGQGDRGILYGAMSSYHSMCRYYSGFFHKHPLVRQYEWYWRVEPDVEFYCDLTYDPFIEMQTHGKKYGFVIMVREIWLTIPNMFRMVKGFLKDFNVQKKSSWKLFVNEYQHDNWFYSRGDYKAKYTNLRWPYELRNCVRELFKIKTLQTQAKDIGDSGDDNLNDDYIHELVSKAKDTFRLPHLQGEQMDDEDYNTLHFWSNFEIARVDLWDNELYDSFFQYMDNSGGFYKERWGDAPIHSLAIGFLLDVKDIHYFRDIGYKHSTIAHCPVNHPSSSINKLFREKSAEWGVGCNCKCPMFHKDVEDNEHDYLQRWFDITRDDYVYSPNWNADLLEDEVKQELGIA